MTDKQFLFCCQEAAVYTDREAYISDLALSSIWGESESPDIPAERLKALGEIWDACHRSFKDIAAAAGMSNRKLAERFLIPYRTAENWSTGQRVPPLYVLLAMQECLGLLDRRKGGSTPLS